MKRAIFVFFAAGLICFGTGCASNAKTILRTEKDPIALLSMVSNGDINWKGEDSTNLRNTGPLTMRSLRDNPDLAIMSSADELINTAERLFRKKVADSGIINLAEKETVFLSRSYKDAKIYKYQVDEKMVIPGDYRYVDYRDKNFISDFARETGIKRSMVVEFKFVKAMESGIGKMGNGRADVEMTIFILDADGKTFLRKDHHTWSISTIKITNGLYSESELMDLFETAIGYAYDDFLDDLKAEKPRLFRRKQSTR